MTTRYRFVLAACAAGLLAATVACNDFGGGTQARSSAGGVGRNLPAPPLDNPNLRVRHLITDGHEATQDDVRAMLALTSGSNVRELPARATATTFTVTTSAPGTLGIQAERDTVVGTGAEMYGEEEEELLEDPNLMDVNHFEEIYEANAGTQALQGFRIWGGQPGWFSVQQAAPARFDLREVMGARYPATRSQGSRNTCAFFALAGLGDIIYATQPGEPIKQASPQFMYWLYHQYYLSRIGNSGAWGNVGTFTLRFFPLLHRDGSREVSPLMPFIPPQLGYIGEDVVPYQVAHANGPTGPNVDRNEAAVRFLGADVAGRIARGETAQGQGFYLQRVALTLASMRAALAGGSPLMISFPVAHNWARPTAATNFAIPELQPNTDTSVGGHAVSVVGYEDDANAPGGGWFIIRNSWGQGWGQNGHGRVSYNHTLRYAYNIAIPVPYQAAFNSRYSLQPPANELPAEVAPGPVQVSPERQVLALDHPAGEGFALTQVGNALETYTIGPCTNAAGQVIAQATVGGRGNRTLTPVALGSCTLTATGAGGLAASLPVEVQATRPAAAPTPAPTPAVALLAGGAAGFEDGNGPAGRFNQPNGLALDAAGFLYVADRANHAIRWIAADGRVETMAGGGTPGFLDGTGIAARFNEPIGVALDRAANVYVADFGNHRIRRITPQNVVTTFAGGGTAGFADGSGAAALFNNPTGVAVDGRGNVYVADWGNQRIRWITPQGVVETWAGSGVPGGADGSGANAQFQNPFGLALDQDNNLYVTDQNGQRLRRIGPDAVVTTIAGGQSPGFADGSGINAVFNTPSGVAVDGNGNAYVADAFNHRVRRVTRAGVVTTFAGSGASGGADGPALAAQFQAPVGIAVSITGSVFVSEQQGHRVRRITP